MSTQPFAMEPIVIESQNDGTFAILLPAEDGLKRIVARGLWEVQTVLAEKVPEKVLLDLELPIRRGIELLTVVRETCPDTEIVARVQSQCIDPRFFSVDLGQTGLRMTPRAGC